MKKAITIILLIGIALNGFSQKLKIFSIIDFGAVGDGKTINSTAIQKTIDAAFAIGGGIVVVPKGKFTTGSIVLRTGVNLHLESGAILAGSDKRKDYSVYQKPALIIAMQQQNIAITGNGIIDGNGRELIKDIFKSLDNGTLTDPNGRKSRPGEGIRTNLFYLADCENITIKGVSLKNATSWVTHYERCRNVTIDSIKLESVAYWNNDGIDIQDCKNVRITNSFINAADDAICLKSGRRNDFCDSIYVGNCTLRSSANAFKLGTGSIGGFKNITVKNIKVYDTYRSAIALEAVDGGFIEHVNIQNVEATNTGNAIFIRLGHRNKDKVYSTVKNIYIANINVTVPKNKPDAGYEMEGPLLMYTPGSQPLANKLISVSPWNYKPENPAAVLYQHNTFPSSITGLPNHPVENVTLENIEINYEGKADKAINYFPIDSFKLITEAEKDYPEFSMFGEVPAWGMFLRHVKGLTIKDATLKMQQQDYRVATIFDDVNGLYLNKIKIVSPKAEPIIILNKVEDYVAKDLQFPIDEKKAVKILQ